MNPLDQGEVTEAVSLNALGVVDQASQQCNNVYIYKGDYITNIQYRYSQAGILQFSVTTATGRRSSFGATVTQINESNVSVNFSLTSSMLYGFLGRMERDNGYLVALGVVSYEYTCVYEEKIRLGNNFYWVPAVTA